MTTDAIAEQRRANLAKARAVKAARGRQQAKVETKTLPRVISDEEEFILRNQGNVQTQEHYSEQDVGSARITHTAPGRVLMWKPGEDGKYYPRTVSESSKGINLELGWKIKCPECGTNHEKSPYPPNDPNSCPAREPVAFRVCPVCGKRVLDNMVSERFSADGNAPDAAMAITDEGSRSTPESRTRVQLDRHLWTFHPRSAEMMGRPPLPVPSRQYDGNQVPV